MDEVWERAVEAALEGQPESSATPRVLTLDGAVKFQSLQHLSIANVGVSSLEKFPRLRNLQRLILSDNRIAGGLEFLVEAGLDSLRDLDLSNNRIQFLEDLAPLARLRLVSLDLYECPSLRLIRSLKYLDKMDADENERPESDEEEEDDEDEDEDDPGSGEIEGEDRARKAVNGGASSSERGGVLDVDEDDESDADEEPEIGGRPKQMDTLETCPMDSIEDLGGEINQEEVDEDVLEVHSEEEDGVEEEDDEEDDEDDDEDDEDDDSRRAGSSGRLASLEGEIDGDELAEEDENGEIGEYDEPEVDEGHESDDDDDDAEDEEEDVAEFLVQPIGPTEIDGGLSDVDGGNDEDVSEEDEVDDDEQRRRRGGVAHPPPEEDEDDEEEEEEDLVDDSRPPPKRR
ncbi:unnamed protein product [Spirodela intermedia]|uniref:Uncharacterized protein n=1 Tax=Spirodela intermedia TaxID=51605 RepID=A0A7I8JB86_SPIIN|nr:unnamed protein product [Spirodela intermedia]CAA6667437.1 unnamed protein product [Spirodela intermedia]